MKSPFAAVLPLVLMVACAQAAPKTPPKKSSVTAAKPKSAAKPATKPAAKPASKPADKPNLVPNPAGTEPVETPPAVPVVSGPKTWALLVGVSHYQSTQISSLHFPALDASGLRDALVDPNLGGLPAQQVLLLTDDGATRDKISGAVDTFLRPNVQSGDKVIVFLAGHGVAKGSGLNAKGYLLPSDAKGLTSAALETSAVPLRALADALGTLPASQFVVFVDACREDPTPGRGIKGNSLTDVLGRGITVVPQDQTAESATFFACSVGQRAFEDPKYGHGVFTNWILEGIRQGAVAQKPDGAIDMGRLSSYVSTKVGEWAKATSSSGDFEVSQTPELIATQLSGPLVLFKIKGKLPDTPVAPSAPRLMVVASPDNAQISLNGERAGVGFLQKSLAADGDLTVNIAAPGYTSISRSVKVLGGYQHQLVVQLQPVNGAGSTNATDDPALSLFRRALEAQEREQWEVAEQGYAATLAANPKLAVAHEAIFDLHRAQNRNLDVIDDALKFLGSAPPSAHSLSFLSRAYSVFAVKGAGVGNANSKLPVVAKYGAPKNPDDAAKLGVRAANEALALGSSAAEANLAQGYALASLDTGGKNKRAALSAFGKAAFLDASDAANQLGLGYGIRFYATQLTKEEDKRAELGRAVAALQEAVKLRPNYYEAHRELAYCYIALDDTPAALRECRLARSNRGAATDDNEVAGIELAMGGLHEKVAQNSTGDVKTANEAASQGYLSDAKETSPDLKAAAAILNAAGLSKSSLIAVLPPSVQQALNWKSTVQGAAQNALDAVKKKFSF